jgi:hypothetical protein
MIQFLPLIAPLVDKLIGLIPDPSARAKAAQEATTELLQLAQSSDQAQGQVNLEQAKSESFFKYGPRPFIMWICGSALALNFLVFPLGIYIAHLFGFIVPPPPVFNDMLWELLLGMLGLGALRTVEKLKKAN